MANVTLWGASYSSVPALEVPATGGGKATFHDVSDTTAVAADVAVGKYFHAADGTLTEGTSSGGGGTGGAVWQDEDGYVHLDSEGGGGSVEVEQKDVNFYDYDGTLLHSYTAAEASALTELPSNPSHTGLTAQGWNYTLAQMKAEVTAQGQCDIGQMYVTDDGKTRIYITLEELRKSFYLAVAPNGTVVIDWGDGTSTDTITGTSVTSRVLKSHAYSASGDYVITLAVTGTMGLLGHSNSTWLITKEQSVNNTYNAPYQNSVRKIELGSSVVIGDYSFNRLRYLQSITIPQDTTCNLTQTFQDCYSLPFVALPPTVTALGQKGFTDCRTLHAVSIPPTVTTLNLRSFENCYALKRLVLPNRATSWNSSTFYYCTAIEKIIIPNGVTTLDNAFSTATSLKEVIIPDSVTTFTGTIFYGDMSLVTLTIPSGVTSIPAQCFYNCHGMKEYHFKATTPPTLANTNAFNGIASDCIIYVPSGTLSAYQSATNWSTYASYMQEEPT